MSTETPETDAKWNLETNKGHFHDWRSVAFEMRDQSRSLERRNSEITVRIAELERNLAHEQQQSAKIDACLNTQLETITARNTQIDRMRLELAEARKDSARIEKLAATGCRELSWKNDGGPSCITVARISRCVSLGRCDINLDTGEVGPELPLLTIREAIDALPLPEKEGQI